MKNDIPISKYQAWVLLAVKSKKQAAKVAPWAVKFEKVAGGFLAFSSIADHTFWKTGK